MKKIDRTLVIAIALFDALILGIAFVLMAGRDRANLLLRPPPPSPYSNPPDGGAMELRRPDTEKVHMGEA